MKCCDCLYYYNIEINEIPECNWHPHTPGDCMPCEEEEKNDGYCCGRPIIIRNSNKENKPNE